MRGFTAIDLTPELKVRISRLAEGMPEQNSLSFVRESDMHMTLHFFANLWEDQKPKVIEAIEGVSTGPFEAHAKGIAYFGDSDVRVIYAKVEDPDGRISGIYDEMSARLFRSGVRYDRRERFVPHITIARCKAGTPVLRKFIQENSEYDFGTFQIGSISFQKSTLSERGPVYDVLFERDI